MHEPRMQRMIEDAKRETRLATARANELERHTLPTLEYQRDELRKKAGGRVRAPQAAAPEGTFRLRVSVTVREGSLIEGALLTADPALAKPGGPMLVSAETLEMLQAEGFAQ